MSPTIKKMEVIILGCGSSGGVPRSDGNWGRCNENNPKNRRMRCSILVKRHSNIGETTNVLIDTSPDLREQFIKSKTTYLDALLYTHDHADQTHGIDDLRPLVYVDRHRIDAYIADDTAQSLLPKFSYIFKGHEVKNYPALLNHLTLPPHGENLIINGKGGDISFVPLEQSHGQITSWGFRFENIAYCNDTNLIPEKSLQLLHGLDLFIVDALRYLPHPSHAHLEQTLEWINLLKPKFSILTNLHIDMDYEELLAQLPENVIPAYDMLSWRNF